jgi:hypothetical protein
MVDYWNRPLLLLKLNIISDHFPVSPQLVDVTHTLKLSAGVSNSNVFRGRSSSLSSNITIRTQNIY